MTATITQPAVGQVRISEPLSCPECESTSWVDYEHCRETLRIRLHTADEDVWGTEKSTYYETDDSDGWECDNGHAAPDEFRETLDELRSYVELAT